jgi:hypothetical protein
VICFCHNKVSAITIKVESDEVREKEGVEKRLLGQPKDYEVPVPNWETPQRLEAANNGITPAVAKQLNGGLY